MADRSGAQPLYSEQGSERMRGMALARLVSCRGDRAGGAGRSRRHGAVTLEPGQHVRPGGVLESGHDLRTFCCFAYSDYVSLKYKLRVTFDSIMDNSSHAHALQAPTNASPRSVQGYSNGQIATVGLAATDGQALQRSAFAPRSPGATVFPALRPRQPRPADIRPPSQATLTLADLPPWSPQAQRHLDQGSSSLQETYSPVIAAAADGSTTQHHVIAPWSSTAILLPASRPAQHISPIDQLAIISSSAPVAITPAFRAPPPKIRTGLQQSTSELGPCVLNMQAEPPSPDSASTTAYEGDNEYEISSEWSSGSDDEDRNIFD
ncbi:hypothetical protein BS78_05G121100 [Paspalum vaginatum]|nr:hypothetical protein BS78_05G121100 [Paspalum vaginatum]